MDIDLGFAEKARSTAWLSNRYFPSKLGGRPAWLELEDLPGISTLLCNKCRAPKSFLCQLYAPYDDIFNFHRTIYVFVCRNADCQEANKANNITALRAQLPRKNKFYSEEEPSEDGEPLPAIQCLKKLCAACGCYAPHTCSRCKSINYCSSAHQRAHWSQHKPDCGTITTISGSQSQLEDIVFPEYEIVMDSNPTDGKNESNEEDGEQERARLAEFEDLAASGKTGELKDVSEAELDKYFGSSAAVDDKTFRIFKMEIAAEPEQIVRYKRGGTPLWIANTTGTVDSQLQSVPNCSQCGGPRQFEFQIMPQTLVILKDDRLDWGVIAIYTCTTSCDIKGYVEEHVIKQDIVDKQS
ncbi:programmed cell death protein 2 [Scaptodrosophila lebanonensis]|uniref:Programmed cell death protein 2 n=1 Tax=Drosophila lebanonensis TaxID=7225 RepID=A0A6J2T1A2_DROLE|nr:programmed cell death protein 2 [Scaptodrosophila lebanonensis]